MGTKKGQVRKTARRAYEPKKKPKKKQGKWIEWKDFTPAGFSKMPKGRFLKMKDGRYLVWKK